MEVLTILRREHAQVKSLFREFEGIPARVKDVSHDNAEERTLYEVFRTRAARKS